MHADVTTMGSTLTPTCLVRRFTANANESRGSVMVEYSDMDARERLARRRLNARLRG